MIRWLYKNIFRGIGIVMLIGMLTILLIKINQTIQHRRAPATLQQPVYGERR